MMLSRYHNIDGRYRETKKFKKLFKIAIYEILQNNENAAPIIHQCLKDIFLEPFTRVGIYKQSEIVRRQDLAVNSKIHETNALLSNLCEEANWYFIRHDNIDTKHLNGSGLYLNRKGTAILAKNYIDFLKN